MLMILRLGFEGSRSLLLAVQRVEEWRVVEGFLAVVGKIDCAAGFEELFAQDLLVD